MNSSQIFLQLLLLPSGYPTNGMGNIGTKKQVVGNGATRLHDYVYGSASDQMVLLYNLPYPSTVCSLSRYTSTAAASQKAILSGMPDPLTGTSTYYEIGHSSSLGAAGVVEVESASSSTTYFKGDRSSAYTGASSTNWVPVCTLTVGCETVINVRFLSSSATSLPCLLLSPKASQICVHS